MSNRNNRWSALSLKDKAALMNMYVSRGILGLREIKNHYNSFDDGGSFGDFVVSENNTNVQPVYWDNTYLEPAVIIAETSEGNLNTGASSNYKYYIKNPKEINARNIIQAYRDRDWARVTALEQLSGIRRSYKEGGTKKPIFDSKKILEHVPAREWVINDNGDIMPGTAGIGTALMHYILSKGKGKKAEELIQQILSTEDKDSELYKDALHYQNHLEALKKYLGTSYNTSVLEESEYKPTIAENKDAKYYKFSSHNNDYYGNVITDLAFQEKDNKQYIDPTLNTFTAYKGRDDKGDYVSIYDTWDYNPTVTGGHELLNSIIDKVTGGKPFEIYDRIYLDDYYDIPEAFRGNPFIAPAIVVDTNAFMETD